MRNETDYPEYEAIRATHGEATAMEVGEMIEKLHAGAMATIQRGASMLGTHSVVVINNTLQRLMGEALILERALGILARSRAGEKSSVISNDEFVEAVALAQKELILESKRELN